MCLEKIGGKNCNASLDGLLCVDNKEDKNNLWNV